MVFSSVTFLFIFLPLTLLLVRLAKPNVKAMNGVLLVMSLLFYAWGEPVYLFLMLLSSAVNYFTAFAIRKRPVFVFNIIFNLALLALFKYAGFFTEMLNALTGAALPVPEIPLPIGISFYTFQTMSYIIDLRRGEAALQKNYFRLLLYITLFPQLIAGPIVRYSDIEEQMSCREITSEDLSCGTRRFVRGLAKKLLIANQMAYVVDSLYGKTAFTFSLAWVLAGFYVLQLYFDFSGYSDMAIGLGRLFGFRFRENFDYPLRSASMQAFWRRWHISLSSWFKEYLYIPLGGNRKGKFRTHINRLIVFFLTGLWHGAALNFILWGLWQWLWITLEKIFAPVLKRVPKLLRHLLTLVLVLFGFVLFRADTLSMAAAQMQAMLRPGLQSQTADLLLQRALSPFVLVVFALAWLLALRVLQRIKVPKAFRLLGTAALWILCLLRLAASSYNALSSFRF
mgnify:CR=1 FL=1